jgi:hypothetical protein
MKMASHGVEMLTTDIVLRAIVAVSIVHLVILVTH